MRDGVVAYAITVVSLGLVALQLWLLQTNINAGNMGSAAVNAFGLVFSTLGCYLGVGLIAATRR